jgi:uncharacterized membrane protein
MLKPIWKRLQSSARYLVPAAALLIIAVWLHNTPPGLFGKLDAIAYAVCHRISQRSFHIGSQQLPLCARCTGMYLAAVAGLVFQIVHSRKKSKFPPWGVSIPLILLAVAFAIDGSNSYLYLIKTVLPGSLSRIPNLYPPNNTLRLLTGSGMGLGISAILYPAFNQTLWKDAPEQPALTWKPFLVLLAATLVLDLLVLTGSPIVLYPVAVISTLGVLVLLTMVYTVVWIMLMRQDNTFTRLGQVWVPLVGGLTIAMLQIYGVDMLRLWLTGTWSGFRLPG